MSIILSRKTLGDSLDVVEKALSRQSTVQYLENILCEIEEDRLILSATNLELSIKVSLPLERGGSGKVLLPSKIAEIVRFLPESDVTFDFNSENFQIDLSSGQSKYNLFGADPSEFPPLERIRPENGAQITIDPSDLKQILKMIIFAASAEETRPAFNGVLFEFSGNRWSLMSSDTYRLAVKDMTDDSWNFNAGRYLVPAKALRELLKIIERCEEQIVLFPSSEQLVFDLGRIYFAARLLNEKYPDISSVVPERYLTRVGINRAEMADTIGRAALLAEGSNSAVNLSVDGGSLTVRVSSQIGRMEEKIDVKQEGDGVGLYINSRFVMDILRAASSEEMVVDFHGKTGPVIFRLPGDEGFLYLVLPIKMN